MSLRPLLAVAVLVLLVRVARVSWRHRGLTVALWRAVRWRHLVGALALLGLVGGTASVLVSTVPGMDLGLGRLLGTSSNVVFAPLEEGLARAAPPPTGIDWPLLLGAVGFLVPLALLLPWLAFVEEEVFRAGLERARWPRVALASLGFGLAHLAVLVPVGAALAIALAGFAYAVAYRRGYARADDGGTPDVAWRAFRPTRRSAALAGGAPDVERRQAAGVFAAAVWHATFNTLVVASVLGSMAVAAVR